MLEGEPMDADDFRRTALSFDGAEEGSHMGSPDFVSAATSLRPWPRLDWLALLLLDCLTMSPSGEIISESNAQSLDSL
jgi:hypothetical protein